MPVSSFNHLFLCCSSRLFEVVETYSKIHLVMEYAAGGELFHRISSEGKMSEPEAKMLFYQVVSAVHHLVSECNRSCLIKYLQMHLHTWQLYCSAVHVSNILTDAM